MIGLLTGRAGLWAVAILAIVAVLAAAWWLIDSRARLALELDACRASLIAWERVQDADVSRGDPADDLGWMQRRAAGQR